MTQKRWSLVNIYDQCRIQKFGVGGAIRNYWIKGLKTLSFSKIMAKRQLFLVHNGLGLGVQMPPLTTTHSVPDIWSLDWVVEAWWTC